MKNLVEGLNQYIEEQRKKLNIDAKGHLVIRKIKNSTSIKAYKEYIFILYYVTNSSVPIVISRAIDRVINGEDKHLHKQLDIKFIKDLTGFITSEDFNKIIDGTYGNTNE